MDHCVGDLGVSHPVAPACPTQHVRRVAHRLHATRDGHRVVACCDGLRGGDYGLEPRPADAVDRHRRHVMGHTRLDRGLASDVHALPTLQDATQHDIAEVRWRAARADQGLAHGNGPEVCDTHVLERSAKRTDGRAARPENDCSHSVDSEVRWRATSEAHAVGMVDAAPDYTGRRRRAGGPRRLSADLTRRARRASPAPTRTAAAAHRPTHRRARSSGAR